jgi:hypothetical protein
MNNPLRHRSLPFCLIGLQPEVVLQSGVSAPERAGIERLSFASVGGRGFGRSGPPQEVQMLNRILLMAAAGLMALGIAALAAPAPAEAHHRHGYSGGGIYLQFGHAPRYYRKKPRQYYRYYNQRPRHYRQYRPYRANRYHRNCRRVLRWARANTSDPRMQARILRSNGC